MEEIELKIKMTSNAKIYNVKIAKSDTILKLKEEVEKQTQIPPLSQNLVYKGRILVNEKLVSDYKIENEHTIILVKKHTVSQKEPEAKSNQATTTNTSNTDTNTTTASNANTNNTAENTNNNASNNNTNPFGGMGMGGQMLDLSSLLGNIDPNEINNMMQSMRGLGDLGGLDGLNPQMIGQILSDPFYMNMMNNMLQNPEMIQMALNSPQLRQMAQNNPNMQALLNNPELIQQMINPQTMQMMSNMFGGMGNQGTGNTNTNTSTNNTNSNNAGTAQNSGSTNPNPLGMDFSQLSQMLGNMGGLGGLGGLDGMGNSSNTGNVGNTGTNDDNVDYKEKYKDQLAQLKDMGFINEETNIQVLKQCSGNVQFAIEKLLNMLG